MSSPTHTPAKMFLYKVKEYMMDPSTRQHAFQRVSEEFHVSINALRMASMREGLSECDQSLKYAFPKEYEEALVAACVMYARQGTPLTKHDFAELATRFAKRGGDNIFSYDFVDDFVERHKSDICFSAGNILSPTRSSDTTVEKTKEFISSLDRLFATNSINEHNLVVFDETVISPKDSVKIVIRDQRKSSDRNGHVVRSRERALCSYIPFSLADGSTPFRVTLYKTGDGKKKKHSVIAHLPSGERWQRGDPYRLLLPCDSGYLTAELFKYIMEQFTSYWTLDHPGLDCYMICDNLRIHLNYDIVSAARRKGIHIFTIMPGTSHWFQVQDQLPFASLKKKIGSDKKRHFDLYQLNTEAEEGST